MLSVFDGMSCGRIALDRAGIKYDKYYASEIDKYAIQVAQKNYPDTIQVGDVTELKASDLRIDTSLEEYFNDGTNEMYDVEAKIDLLIGGSPCQGFSVSGKQLNFEDPRSALFFEFVRLLKELKPKYFLLENVKMKKEWQDIITMYLEVSPIEINSALVSAQNRKRLYWTNISYSGKPRNKGIMLQDILEQDATEPMLSNIYGGFGEKKPRVHYDKSVTLRTPAGGGHIPSVALATDEMTSKEGKAHCLTSTYYKLGTSDAAVKHCIKKRGRTMVGLASDVSKVVIGGGFRSRRNPADVRKKGKGKQLELRTDGKANCLTPSGLTKSHPSENMIVRDVKGGKFRSREGATRLEDRADKKSNTLLSGSKGFAVYGNIAYRKLTPLECERLQTVPEGYTEGVSKTQRYKMLGNGWTVDVIAHLFEGIGSGEFRKAAPIQQRLF